MSTISKFTQITDKVLLEYSYDKSSTEYSNFNNYYVIKDRVGHKNFIGNSTYQILSDNNRIGLHNSSIQQRDGSYFYLGANVNSLQSTFDKVKDMTYLNNDYLIKSFSIPDMTYDTIRVHFLTGFVLGDLGLLIKFLVEDVNKNPVTLGNFTITRTNMSRLIKFNPNPIYMSTRFYDRYLEFKIPSIYKLGAKFADRMKDPDYNKDSDPNDIYEALQIKPLSDLKYEFSYILSDNFIPTPAKYGAGLGSGYFTIDSIIKSNVTMSSAADNFNVYLAEDPEAGMIRYYATWGDEGSYQSRLETNPDGSTKEVKKIPPVLNLSVLDSLESGAIPLYTGTDSASINADWEAFADAYGTNARKWVTIHELYFTEVYSSFVDNPITGSNSAATYIKRFSFTETYETSTVNSSDETFKYYFKPVVGIYAQNYQLDSLNIVYNCRLVNRMDGTQIVRTASMAIPNPLSKYGPNAQKIQVSNTQNIKVYNKIESPALGGTVVKQHPSVKYEKVFYNLNSIRVQTREEGIYNQIGNIQLLLFKSDHYYKFRLITDDDSTGNQIRLDLSGAFTYILRFKDKNGVNIDCRPTYSKNMNIILGELEFHISEDKSKKIMEVPENERRFSLLVLNPSGNTSTIAEGEVYGS